MARRGSLAFLAVLLLAGCAGPGAGGSWSMRWPSAVEAREAAVAAVRSPATWAPLAGAALLQIDDWDEQVSDWAADERPVFGERAEAWSDDLRLASNAAWLLSTLPQPDSNSADPLLRRLGMGASALLLERAVTYGIKEAVDRRRPDDSDAQSFPSGHAGNAAAATTLARRNVAAMNLPGRVSGPVRVGLYGLAAGTAWARVEARRHYAGDVLAGYAVGRFLAAFVADAFQKVDRDGARVNTLTADFQALPRGGAITVRLGRIP